MGRINCLCMTAEEAHQELQTPMICGSFYRLVLCKEASSSRLRFLRFLRFCTGSDWFLVRWMSRRSPVWLPLTGLSGCQINVLGFVRRSRIRIQASSLFKLLYLGAFKPPYSHEPTCFVDVEAVL